ncbi:ATP-dependent zinc protease [Enterovibrio sp. ZSDZ35]|uniref:ATP-dependent zinc protease n=1 Tax=Enterovibrio qingdaonensis TaxID=2899818 RepID=A0ABT5QFP5_9GAMM|nr:ATP-dependent zinc protease [Enterovibrio sp. ZSDZ35]MDD1779800.1 ATP-dependent zinc protease [Enterovibrio sp. ZSDZ35]
MKYKFVAFFFLLCLSPISFAASNADTPVYEHAPDGKLIMGEKEWVKVDTVGVTLKARVDTGATTSSISAIDIQSFKKDGENWVRFRLAHDGRESRVIELPVVRTVRIIQSSAEGYDRRYVVKLPITIGDVTEETQFTLRDRQHLIFPVLLGRSYLKGMAMVDVSRQYVQPKPDHAKRD